jgi:uncharacterized protein
LYDAKVWERFLGAVSRRRVLFGSDYPLNLYPLSDPEPAMKGFIAEARTAGMADDVLGRNAARLLGL